MFTVIHMYAFCVCALILLSYFESVQGVAMEVSKRYYTEGRYQITQQELHDNDDMWRR